MKKILFVIIIMIAGLFLIGKCNEVNAYHLNEDGNIVSENLFDISSSEYRSDKNFDVELTDNKYVISNVNASGRIIDFTIPILEKNKDYTLNLNISGATLDNIQIHFSNTFGEEDSYNEKNYYIRSETIPLTYNYDTAGNYNLAFVELYLKEVNSEVIVLDIMLNEGSEALEYEPYGTYYKFEYGNQNFELSSVVATWEGQESPVDVMDKIIKSEDELYFEDIVRYAGSDDVVITVSFANNLSTDAIYAFRFVESIGSSIEFYQDETMIKYIEGEECDNLICKIDFEGVNYNSFNKIVVRGTNQDHYPFSFSSYSTLYQAGYDTGYHDGVYDGTSLGYKNGYNKGQRSAELDIYGFFPGIIGAILSFFYTIMQFSIFGISIFDIFVLLFGISMVVLILKIINGGGN